MGAQHRSAHAPAADAIVGRLSPHTVLATGSAAATVADDLRARGVDVGELQVTAHGTPPGDTPPGNASPGEARESLGRTDDSAAPERPDLVVCVGAPDPTGAEAGRLVAALAAAGDAVLFSAGGPQQAGDPDQAGDPRAATAPAEDRAGWARLFAEHGLFRDLDHDAGYLAPDAVLFRRARGDSPGLVRRYEQALADLRARADADVARLEAEVHQLRKEILRTRDVAFGRQAELASAQARLEHLESELARYDNVEQRLHDVLNSRSWRLTQTIALPVRILRQRR